MDAAQYFIADLSDDHNSECRRQWHVLFWSCRLQFRGLQRVHIQQYRHGQWLGIDNRAESTKPGNGDTACGRIRLGAGLVDSGRSYRRHCDVLPACPGLFFEWPLDVAQYHVAEVADKYDRDNDGEWQLLLRSRGMQFRGLQCVHIQQRHCD